MSTPSPLSRLRCAARTRKTRACSRVESGVPLFGLPVTRQRFLYLAASEAASTDPDSPRSPIDFGSYPLQIRLPSSRRNIMSMTDTSTGHRLLFADCTLFGHVTYLLDITLEGRLPYQNQRAVPRGKGTIRGEPIYHRGNGDTGCDSVLSIPSGSR